MLSVFKCNLEICLEETKTWFSFQNSVSQVRSNSFSCLCSHFLNGLKFDSWCSIQSRFRLLDETCPIL
jgi:hypothetical protein